MGTKITNLPQVITPTGTDELAISQDDGSGGRNTYKTTLDQVKNYVKNTGGGTGTVNSVGVNSTDGSISVFGSPIVGAGTITINVSSVGLDKLDDGGAMNGQILTYNGTTSTWVASAAPKELPQTASTGQVLTYNGTTSTWVASSLSANGFSCSKTIDGYTYLPNGILMQWGRFAVESTNFSERNYDITFFIPFPNDCLSVTPSIHTGTMSDLQALNNSPQVSNITSTGFTIYNQCLADVGGTGTMYFIWQAIGH